MLVLSRKTNESILIDGQIRVTVLGIRGNQVRIGIEAPGSVKVVRAELLAEPAPPPAAADAETAAEMRARRPAPLSRAARRDRPVAMDPAHTPWISG